MQLKSISQILTLLGGMFFFDLSHAQPASPNSIDQLFDILKIKQNTQSMVKPQQLQMLGLNQEQFWQDIEPQLKQLYQKNLSEEDQNELKRLWRQASKLCHPDLVADDLKEEANTMMVQLNQAKQRGDVKAIRSLVARLQQGFEPLMASDRLNDLERIRKKMAQVREQIDILVNELAELEKEESWLLVSSLNNMEAYFAQQEKALHEVRASLEHQVSEAQLDSAA